MWLKKIKNNESDQSSNKRQNKLSQKTYKPALSSNSSANSSSTLIIASIVWTIIVVLFQFIQDLLIVAINYFRNADNTVSDVDRRIKETKRNEILRMKHENITYLKQWPNAPRMENAFTNVNFCLGEDNVSIYGNDFSPVDSGIGSRPVSFTDTNETLSDCTEESGIIHAPLRYRTRKWCDRSDYDQIAPRNSTCHVSRRLTRARQDSFAASSRLPIHRSIREDLSITRHIARVRNAHRKRAKSAVAVIRLRESESGMRSYQNNSTFYEDFNR